jgi:hypothetical protein
MGSLMGLGGGLWPHYWFEGVAMFLCLIVLLAAELRTFRGAAGVALLGLTELFRIWPLGLGMLILSLGLYYRTRLFIERSQDLS